MTGPAWSAGGCDVTPVSEYRRDAGVVVRTKSGHLTPELARSLAWWLLWWVGDRPEPADPDRVRVAVDEQRAALRQRSAAAETTEEFRAGLAWADRSLAAIAEAAT